MKKLRSIWSFPVAFTLVLLFGFGCQANSQSVDVEFEVKRNLTLIKGSVLDSKSGAALEMVTIFILNERNDALRNANNRYSGTMTDTKGNFGLGLQKTDSLIVFRKEGYETIVHSFKGEEEIHIKLIKSPTPNKEGND